VGRRRGAGEEFKKVKERLAGYSAYASLTDEAGVGKRQEISIVSPELGGVGKRQEISIVSPELGVPGIGVPGIDCVPGIEVLCPRSCLVSPEFPPADAARQRPSQSGRNSVLRLRICRSVDTRC
jgi:hypothetical protein